MSDIVVVGSINVDLAIAVPHAPRRGETLLGGAVRRSGGGKGANQAVGCARLERSVSMIGAVGADADGEYMLGLLADEGVDTSAVVTLDTATGQAVILVEPDGESTIVVAPGANSAFSVADLDAAAEIVASAGCVLAQQEIDASVVARASELVTGLFVLNPAPARPIDARVLARVDVLVPNRHELATLCGEPTSDRIEDVARMALGLRGPGSIVVTLGAEGALVVEHGGAHRVPAVAVTAVDATAAGDTFCAALADSLLRGYSTTAAASRACQAAAVTVQRRGAMESMPRGDQIHS
ncbi:MAG: ribokinase [Coriobacteriia bacterium]